MGGAGDSPAPLGDPPSETGAALVFGDAVLLSAGVIPVPSGRLPDGTGW